MNNFYEFEKSLFPKNWFVAFYGFFLLIVFAVVMVSIRFNFSNLLFYGLLFTCILGLYGTIFFLAKKQNKKFPKWYWIYRAFNLAIVIALLSISY